MYRYHRAGKFQSVQCLSLWAQPRNRGSIPGMDKDISLFLKASSPDVGPTQPPIQRVREDRPMEIKRPRR